MTDDDIIRSARLLLRKVRSTDRDQVYHIFSQALVSKHYDCYAFKDQKQAVEWIDWNLSLYKYKGLKGFRWAITLIEDPCTLIGSCGVHSINSRFHSVEIGYELDPAYWGKGIATEALTVLIKACFEHDFPIKLNRITATTHLINPASIAVLNKLGFEEEGILREYGYWKDEYHTVRLFSLLRRDWLDDITL
jgi:ribosomal-protein-alanine N-acetyltransferase